MSFLPLLYRIMSRWMDSEHCSGSLWGYFDGDVLYMWERNLLRSQSVIKWCQGFIHRTAVIISLHTRKNNRVVHSSGTIKTAFSRAEKYDGRIIADLFILQFKTADKLKASARVCLSVVLCECLCFCLWKCMWM